MTINKQLKSIIDREEALKKEMAQLSNMKKQLHDQKQKQDILNQINAFTPYVAKFAKLGIHLELKVEYDEVTASIDPINDDDRYEGAYYSGDELTKENLDKLLNQLEHARYIEQHTKFKLISTDNEIYMELHSAYHLYKYCVTESNGMLTGAITKENMDTNGEYVHNITPQLSIHIDAVGYDNFYVTWVHKIAGTKNNIIDEIENALKTLKQI